MFKYLQYDKTIHMQANNLNSIYLSIYIGYIGIQKQVF